jgi:hypothetical protein
MPPAQRRNEMASRKLAQQRVLRIMQQQHEASKGQITAEAAKKVQRPTATRSFLI